MCEILPCIKCDGGDDDDEENDEFTMMKGFEMWNDIGITYSVYMCKS